MAAASIGLAATVTDVRPTGKAIADLGHSLAAGVILGSSVWPYGLSPVPPELQSAPLLGFSNCDGQGQCGIYRLATDTLVDGRAGTADIE